MIDFIPLAGVALYAGLYIKESFTTRKLSKMLNNRVATNTISYQRNVNVKIDSSKDENKKVKIMGFRF